MGTKATKCSLSVVAMSKKSELFPMVFENPDDTFLTVTEVCHTLKMKKSFVYELIYKNELTTYSFGRSKRIKKSDLWKWVSRNQRR
jgi:excisionase family DNA binding protein